MFIHQTLQRAVRLFGNKEAIVSGDVRLTYTALEDRIGRLAGALADAGVRPGDHIAVMMLNCHRYLETYFAAERAGAVLAPLNHRLAPAEVSYILNDGGITLLLIDAAFLPVYTACAADLTTLRKVIVAGGERDPRFTDYEQALMAATPMTEVARAWQEDDLVHLYYTSGTTGRAKGVMLSQKNVISNAKHMIINLRLVPDDVFLHAAPMFHLADAWACWTVAWLGGKHVFLREFSAAGFLNLVQRERVSLTLIVPTMINLVINHPDIGSFDIGSLRLVAFGASPMPVDRLVQAMQVLGCGFTHMYGMTETAPLATALAPEEMVPDGTEAYARRLLSCGREVVGVQVRVVRDDGTDVAPGEVGEIVMRGPNVMLGYWNQPDTTAVALRHGWMHSGDLATWDADGYITIVDRAKDMIITGGENVYSTEVEDALYAHPAVLEAAVIAVPDERWGERVHAIVVLREGQSADADALTAHCRSRIAGYKVPRSYDFLPSLPKTGSGKIQKALLRDPYWQGRERRVN